MVETSNESPSRDADSDLGFEIDDPSGRRRLWATALGIGGFVAALALLPMAIGFGPFGLRLLLSDEIPVHVLNVSGEDVNVSLSFASDVDVPAGSMETLATLSGRSRLVATRADGTVVDDLEIDATGDVFYNVAGGKCFVVFDISSFYLGEDEQQGDMTVVARLYEDTRVYAFTSDSILLPRRVPPDQARGSVHWLEPVGCAMLEPSEEPYLIAQSLMRLQSRRERYEEELREAREAAGQAE